MSRVRKRTPRKHSAYLEAMPNSAVIHIQKSAPGPPIEMAAATPTMLPVPTVAASAVDMAANEEMSPFSPLVRERRPNPRLMALVNRRSWMPRRRMVMKTPVPKSRGRSSHGPQIRSRTVSKLLCRDSMGGTELSVRRGSKW